MKTDGISFIISNRNHETGLPRSIRSALLAIDHLAGHGVPGEAIVVDDASGDGSRVLLRQLETLYHERGLRALSLGRDTGPAAARNTGLHRARHRYAALLDAGCEIVPQNVYHFYRSIRATGAAVVYGNVIDIDDSSVDVVSNERFVARMFERDQIGACALYDVHQLLDAATFGPGRDAAAAAREMHLHLAASGRRLVHVPMVFGLCYREDPSRIDDDTPEAREGDTRRLRRIDRRHPGARDCSHLNAPHPQYHPDLGYL